MNVNISQEATTTSQPLWVSNICAFFHLPNPRIFQLFIIGCTVTLSLGIAMTIEWDYHGCHHPGYQWIVYYALCTIALPVLLWIISLVSAITTFCSKKGQVVDQSKSEQIQDVKVQVELGQASHDQQVEVQVQHIHNNNTCDSTNGPVSASLRPMAKAGEDKNDESTLKRSSSLPLSNSPTENGKIKRALSF